MAEYTELMMDSKRELEWMEWLLKNGDERDRPHIRRHLQALKRHMSKCSKSNLVKVDPFGVNYDCQTCGERVCSSRYLVSGLSVVEAGGHTKSGRLPPKASVLDTFTGIWYDTDKKGNIPHDNRCHHCGQDMSGIDHEIAAETFNPKSDVG